MESESKQILTVAELIALLQQMPQDKLVYHEGCDCYGEANGVKDEGEHVLITRNF